MNIRVSIDSDDPRKAELERIALHKNLTLEGLMDQLIDQRLEHERWLDAEVQKGIDDARAGRVIDHADGVAEIEAYMAAREAKRA